MARSAWFLAKFCRGLKKFKTSSARRGVSFSAYDYDFYKKENVFFNFIAYGRNAERIERAHAPGETALLICIPITEKYTPKGSETPVTVTKFLVQMAQTVEYNIRMIDEMKAEEKRAKATIPDPGEVGVAPPEGAAEYTDEPREEPPPDDEGEVF